MTTLDDVERTFGSDAALVCDGEGPSGIAGIMGGQISEVSDKTTRVLMEAATWVGPNIMRTSKALGLRTEASARFEKQLHPELAMAAQRLAARLMVELCGARFVPGDDRRLPAPGRAARGAAAARAHGAAARRADRARAGRGDPARLGFEPADGEGGGPGGRGRRRLARAVLARLRRAPRGRPDRGGRPHPRARQASHDAAGPPERGRGASPAPSACAAGSRTPCATAASTSAWRTASPRPDALERLRLGDVPVLRIDNPLSEQLSVMRPLLLPGLLDAARHNAAHGRPGVALFESAHVYRPDAPLGEPPEGSPRGPHPGARAPPPRGARDRGQARRLAHARPAGRLPLRASAARGAARRGAARLVGGGGRTAVPAPRPRRVRRRRERTQARLARRAPPARDRRVGPRRAGRRVRARPRHRDRADRRAQRHASAT